MNDIATAQEHLEEAYQLETQNKLQEALEACDLAIQLNPDLAEAFNLRGIILEQLGDLDSAIDDYQQAVNLQPSSDVAAQNLFGAQEEASWIKRRQVLKATLFGALGFGFSLMLANVLNAIFTSRIIVMSPEGYRVVQARLGVFQTKFVNSFLLSLGIGLGAGILARVIGSTRKSLLVISSFVGFGFLYLIISIIIEGANFLGIYIFLNRGLDLFASTILYALPGALTGLLFARINGNSRYWLISFLAGSSLAIMVLLNNYQFVGTRWILEAYGAFKANSYLRYDPQRDLTVITAIYEGTRGLLGGSIFGGLLGLTLSIFKSEPETAEFEAILDQPIEKADY